MLTKLSVLTGVSAAFLSLSYASPLLAAAEKIETVYVSATRSEGPQMPVATQITVIDSEQIRVSGATTITDVLRSQAGIQIQDLDGSGGRSVGISMRGFSATSASNTLVLVDGRKLNNPTMAGPALNTIAIKDIERIEIIQGSASVLYGDQAVGGVINVITRRAKAGEINGFISAEKGTGNLENYTASVTQGFDNGLNYSVSAQKRNADNYRDNNQSESTNVLGNMGFNFENGKVFVEHQKIEDDLRLPGSLTDDDLATDRRFTYSRNDFSNQDTDLTRVGGEVGIFKGWKLLGEYADRDETGDYLYDDYYQDNNPLTNDYTPYAVSYEMRVKNISPRVVGNIATKNGNSVVTLGYDKAEGDYVTKDGYTHIAQDVDGFYGQVIYPLTKQFTTILGARHSSVEDTNYVAYDANYNVIAKNRNLSVNAKELGVNYQIDSAWKVFARVADGFRFAKSDENGFTLPGIDFLNVQTDESKEAGVAWSDKTASVTYSFYQMDIDNEITYDAIVPNPPGFNGRGANINLPKSERKGFIFDGDVQLSEQITLRGNYTYTDSELTSGSYKGKEVPFVAKDTANIGLVFNFVKDVTVSFDANYTGKRFHVDDYENTSAKINAVTVFTFNILWDIKDVELGFRVKNITNEKYADYQSIYGQYPQPERAYSAHVSYRF